jgi:hypothetical protein
VLVIPTRHYSFIIIPLSGQCCSLPYSPVRALLPFYLVISYPGIIIYMSFLTISILRHYCLPHYPLIRALLPFIPYDPPSGHYAHPYYSPT